MKTDELQYGLETPSSMSDTMEVKEVPVQLKKRFDVLIAHHDTPGTLPPTSW